MRFLFLLALFSFSTASADAGLDQLRKSFSGLLETSKREFDRAAAMKPHLLKKGKEISKEECDEAQAKIRHNYKVDPFEINYAGGSTLHAMCSAKDSTRKNFIQEVSGQTNFGLPYVFVIQAEIYDHPARERLSNYFIDANYRIVEIQSLAYFLNGSELLEYDITSMDAKGNIYFSQFTKNYRVASTDIEGTQTMEKFIAADGSNPFPLIRDTVKHKSHSAKDYQSIYLLRSDKQDWDGFQLPITHAWSGGFYTYAGKLYGTSRFKSSLSIRYRGGKEQCSFGYVEAEHQKVTRVPSDETLYYQCYNN